MSLVHALTRSLILMGRIINVDTQVDTLLKCSIMRRRFGARDLSLGLLQACHIEQTFNDDDEQSSQLNRDRAYELDEFGALHFAEEVKFNERELARNLHSIERAPIEIRMEENEAFRDLNKN